MRFLSDSIGRFMRFYYFKLIKKPRTWDSLLNDNLAEKGYWDFLAQGFWNRIVGSFTLLILVLVVLF